MKDITKNSTFFILEDNEERIKFFRRVIKEGKIDIAINIEEAIKLLRTKEYDILFLDHDLGGEIYVDSNEQNTGFQLVKYMILNSLCKDSYIIIHSMNHIGAILMYGNLNNNGYSVDIIPFNLILEANRNV